jgi:hypothetical protein
MIVYHRCSEAAHESKTMIRNSLWPANQIEHWPIDRLVPFARNARTHTPAQINQIAASISRWGWTIPVLAAEDGTILAGHARVLAAHKLGLTTVPVIVARGWTEAEKRAYAIADNKLTLNSGWDEELLRIELADLKLEEFPLELLGFDDTELASILNSRSVGATDPDDVPPVPVKPVARPGDLWQLGRHLLVCGDATERADVEMLLAGAQPHLMVTDPPYGVNYDADWRNSAQRANRQPYGGRAVGKVTNDDCVDWRAAWRLFKGDVATGLVGLPVSIRYVEAVALAVAGPAAPFPVPRIGIDEGALRLAEFTPSNRTPRPAAVAAGIRNPSHKRPS